MTTMLEKMARAMARENSLPESDWRKFDGDVRAALEAMREADDLMLKAAFAEMNRTPGRTWKQMKADNATPREMFDAKERPRFTAMIDAILGGEA